MEYFNRYRDAYKIYMLYGCKSNPFQAIVHRSISTPDIDDSTVASFYDDSTYRYDYIIVNYAIYKTLIHEYLKYSIVVDLGFQRCKYYHIEYGYDKDSIVEYLIKKYILEKDVNCRYHRNNKFCSIKIPTV